MPDFFETIALRKTDGRLHAAWVITGESAGAKALFALGGERCAEVFREEAFPAACSEEILRLSGGRTGILELGDTRVFLEPLSAGKRLVLCGAGHVALAVLRICVMLGFEVTVIEEREEFAAMAGSAGAHHVLCRPFEEALDGIEGDFGTAFVLMTSQHLHDVSCLRRILRKSYAYAGMMGSRSRTRSIRQQLLEEGFDAQKLEQVHMPIGLPIGARTPEEIAVSVAAQLIQVMNGNDAGEGFPAGMLEELAALRGREGMEKPDGTEGPARVLTMIVEKNGEGPRRPGTKMLVRRDGSFSGTVGGGYAEACILKAAEEMIREGCQRSRLLRISMKKGAMFCGGEVTVFLLPL